MNSNNFPLCEFDENKKAVIEPHKLIEKIAPTDRAVLCFFNEVIADVVEKYSVGIVKTIHSEWIDSHIYHIKRGELDFMLMHPGVGAAFAAGGAMEEIHALGANKIIACGGGGVLTPDILVGNLFVPTSALRDEGTSYHYAPPSREIQLNPEGIKAIEDTLKANNMPYIKGKTWTTDAFYRETTGKVISRKAEGCMMVEMECAAFAAVAAFRGITFGQILYGGDDVSSSEWDDRGWKSRGEIRSRLLWLAAEAACLGE